MEEIQKVNEALTILERYSDYLARKAWGKTLIIWGIMAPIGLVVYFNNEPLANIFNMSRESFTLLFSALFLLIGVGLTLYTFTSASRLLQTKKNREVSSPKESSKHGIFIGFIWFLLFILASFIPEPFSVISSVWAAGLAIIISYWLLKQYFHDAFPELLLVGVILLLASIPLVGLIVINIGLDLVRTATVVIFSVSFLLGGFYSLTIAKNILSGNE
jgi:hypothetical protein